MNHQASPTQTVGERRLFKHTMYLTFQCTCLFPGWFKSGEGVKFERTRTEKLGWKGCFQISYNSPTVPSGNISNCSRCYSTHNCNYEEKREGQDRRSLKRGEGMRRVNTSGFLQRQQQQQQCLSIFHWLRWSLEEANSSCGSHYWSSMCCIFATAYEFYKCSCGAVGAARAFIAKALQHAKFSSETARLAPMHCVNRAARPPCKHKRTFRLTKEFVA